MSKALDRAAGAERKVVGYLGGRYARTYSEASSFSATGGGEITAPATPEGERWEGWGTALKPSHEPIVVARKPFIGTVAENVLEHGTGAINVDGCRVEGIKDVPASPRRAEQGAAYGDLSKDPGDGSGWDPQTGRWPPNVVLDEQAAAELDEQSGERPGFTSQNDYGTARGLSGAIYGDADGKLQGRREGFNDSGGASRFFYCAKTSRAERNAGLLENLPRTRNPCKRYQQDASERWVKRAVNKHPTVKPINLMRWLVRLVTPPGRIVLDPFLGSGSTGCAAALEGFDFIGIEREAEYVRIAEARIAFWVQHQGREVEDVLGGYTRSQRDRVRHLDQLTLD